MKMYGNDDDGDGDEIQPTSSLLHCTVNCEYGDGYLSKLSNSRYYTSVLLSYISLSAFVLFLSFHVVMGDHPATSPAGNYRNVYLITTECWYPHYALQTGLGLDTGHVCACV